MGEQSSYDSSGKYSSWFSEGDRASFDGHFNSNGDPFASLSPPEIGQTLTQPSRGMAAKHFQTNP